MKVRMATAYQQSWEPDVLPLAYEAEHQSLPSSALSVNDTSLLARAYAYCDAITSTNSKTFSMATRLLPAAKLGRNFYHLTDYFSVQNLPLLIKLKALVKHYDNIGHFVHDPHLKAAFTFQNMYLGLSPFDAPATYSLVQYTELAEGVWYPIGGIYRVIESLTRVADWSPSLGVLAAN